MVALSNSVVDELAELLDRAERDNRPIAKITNQYPDMNWEDAYLIQDALRKRKEARGGRCVGIKAGLTSRIKMKQMGVETPVMGFLMGESAVPDGGAVDISRLIHPRVEAEIAFVLKSELGGPDCDIDAVMEATDFILPAAEIIDSRYENFEFDLKSVIADNTSAARYVTGGAARSASNTDLQTLGIVMEKNGEITATASGAAVLGNPALSVAMLANMVAARGKVIPAGSFIMTGGATEAVAVKAGDLITIRYQHLGSISMRFV
jgi:2-oxo-3-hexenedioate decarboxylase